MKRIGQLAVVLFFAFGVYWIVVRSLAWIINQHYPEIPMDTLEYIGAWVIVIIMMLWVYSGIQEQNEKYDERVRQHFGKHARS